MLNIKVSIFDFFAYLVPGAIIILATIIFLDPSITRIENITKLFEEINFGAGLIVILFSYIVGFIIDYPAYKFYQFVCFTIWKQKYYGSTEEINLIQKQALVNQYSTRNFDFILRWKVLKDMSQNLTLSAFYVFAVTLSKAIDTNLNNQIEWTGLSIVALISCPILLSRAKHFDNKFYKDIGDVVAVLSLDKITLNKDSSS